MVNEGFCSNFAHFKTFVIEDGGSAVEPYPWRSPRSRDAELVQQMQGGCSPVELAQSNLNSQRCNVREVEQRKRSAALAPAAAARIKIQIAAELTKMPYGGSYAFNGTAANNSKFDFS